MQGNFSSMGVRGVRTRRGVTNGIDQRAAGWFLEFADFPRRRRGFRHFRYGYRPEIGHLVAGMRQFLDNRDRLRRIGLGDDEAVLLRPIRAALGRRDRDDVAGGGWGGSFHAPRYTRICVGKVTAPPGRRCDGCAAAR